MWLLNTARAELKFFPTPESVPGGYAILSHAWDDKEQTFQEVEALRIQCAKDGTNPRDLVCDKVRQFCIVAEGGGHEWGWADMCCIDKTSSAELSEAIVAMYRFYSLADVCYVYLRDVPNASEDDLRASGSPFWNSRWHERGWTLQELIAPSLVLFLSSTWQTLGVKADLADTLEKITRIPAAVLRQEREPSVHCVAARMSWAAGRKTTRPEDEAYCLMGIFRIFMPPLYGEGRNAFLRLQEAIMRQEDDPSIFAWGDSRTVLELKELRPMAGGCLFANSPSDFLLGHRITRSTERWPESSQSFWERFKGSGLPDLSKLQTFNMTSYGVTAHLPVFQTGYHDMIHIALLLGIQYISEDHTPHTLGLLLRVADSASYGPTRWLYDSFRRRSIPERLCRLVGYPWELAAKLAMKLEWRTLNIRRTSKWLAHNFAGIEFLTQDLRTPFHIFPSHFATLLRDPCITSFNVWSNYGGVTSFNVLLDFNGHYPGQIDLLHLRIRLGICTKTSPSSSPQHWASIRTRDEDNEEHVCAENHIDIGLMQRSFAVPTLPGRVSLQHTSRLETREPMTIQIQVELSFQPYALNPTHVRTVHFKFKAVPAADPIENGSTSASPAIHEGDTGPL